MAREIERLTARDCTKAASIGKPYFMNDGDGLMLRVSENGAKSWVLRYRLDGLRRDMGLGSLNRVTILEARSVARKLHRQIEDGVDVAKTDGKRVKRQARIRQREEVQRQEAEEARQRVTFRQCAEEYLKDTAAKRSAASASTWHQSLRDFVYPVIGDKAVPAIGTDEVMACLKPHWADKAPTMMKTRGRIEAILDFATVSKYRSGENPARWDGHLEHKLAAPGDIAEVQHQAALPYAEMASFFGELHASTGTDARALEFLILAGTPRTATVVKAKWSEIDLAARVWTIPREHMKVSTAGDHVVPLSNAAIALLEALPPPHEPGDQLFPGLGDKGMYNLVQTFGRVDPKERDEAGKPKPITPHGFRSTFRDWAYDTQSFDHMIVEHCLAHVMGGSSEKAYKRSGGVDKRRPIMEAWSEFCGQTPAAVSVAA